MPDWSTGEDARMAEYRGEDKWSLPLSDRPRDIRVCPSCNREYDSEEGLTCYRCQDAYIDAMESRIDREREK